MNVWPSRKHHQHQPPPPHQKQPRSFPTVPYNVCGCHPTAATALGLHSISSSATLPCLEYTQRGLSIIQYQTGIQTGIDLPCIHLPLLLCRLFGNSAPTAALHRIQIPAILSPYTLLHHHPHRRSLPRLPRHLTSCNPDPGS